MCRHAAALVALLALGAFARADEPAPPARAPVWHRLLLGNDQILTVELLELNDTSIAFRTSWGTLQRWPRTHIVGIVQPENLVQIFFEDFESPLMGWTSKANATNAVAFSGSKCIALTKPGEMIERAVPKGCTHLSLYFQPGPGEITVAHGGLETTLRRDRLPVPRVGWRLLLIERDERKVRAFVDDYLVAEADLDAKANSLRIENRAAGAWHVDAVRFAEQLPSRRRPLPPAKGDAVWQIGDEQTFGRVLRADVRVVEMETSLGKVKFPWSKVRGILLDGKPAAPVGDADIWIRPGPGLPIDRLRVQILQHDEDTVSLKHALLGEFSLTTDHVQKKLGKQRG